MFYSLNHHLNSINNNKISLKVFNKGYFSNMHKKIIYSVYMIIKTEFNKKLGRKCKASFILLFFMKHAFNISHIYFW